MGSRAFSVSTDLFDKDNNFILYDDFHSQPVNESDLLEVRIYRYLFYEESLHCNMCIHYGVRVLKFYR